MREQILWVICPHHLSGPPKSPVATPTATDYISLLAPQGRGHGFAVAESRAKLLAAFSADDSTKLVSCIKERAGERRWY